MSKKLIFLMFSRLSEYINFARQIKETSSTDLATMSLPRSNHFDADTVICQTLSKQHIKLCLLIIILAIIKIRLIRISFFKKSTGSFNLVFFSIALFSFRVFSQVGFREKGEFDSPKNVRKITAFETEAIKDISKHRKPENFRLKLNALISSCGILWNWMM